MYPMYQTHLRHSIYTNLLSLEWMDSNGLINECCKSTRFTGNANGHSIALKRYCGYFKSFAAIFGNFWFLSKIFYGYAPPKILTSPKMLIVINWFPDFLRIAQLTILSFQIVDTYQINLARTWNLVIMIPFGRSGKLLSVAHFTKRGHFFMTPLILNEVHFLSWNSDTCLYYHLLHVSRDTGELSITCYHTPPLKC